MVRDLLKSNAFEYKTLHVFGGQALNDRELTLIELPSMETNVLDFILEQRDGERE